MRASSTSSSARSWRREGRRVRGYARAGGRYVPSCAVCSLEGLDAARLRVSPTTISQSGTRKKPKNPSGVRSDAPMTTVAQAGGVRRRCFEHADERECCSCEEGAAEGHRAVAGVGAVAPEPLLEARPEEDEQERNQGREQKSGNLVLAAVVVPVGERLGRRGLAARIAPRQGETDEEQQPDEHSGERQKASESIRSHTVPIRGVACRRPYAVRATSRATA